MSQALPADLSSPSRELEREGSAAASHACRNTRGPFASAQPCLAIGRSFGEGLQTSGPHSGHPAILCPLVLCDPPNFGCHFGRYTQSGLLPFAKC